LGVEHGVVAKNPRKYWFWTVICPPKPLQIRTKTGRWGTNRALQPVTTGL
jgi:hypothetical protein